MKKRQHLRNKNHSDQNKNINLRYGWILQLIYFSFQLLLFCHILACCWYYLSNNQTEEGWIYEIFPVFTQATYQYSKIHQYITSFYFILTTVLTIGYGDIFPITKNERLFVIFIILGGIVYGVILTKLRSILSSRALRAKFNKDRMLELRSFLNNKNNLPTSLKFAAQVANYWIYFYYLLSILILASEVNIFFAFLQ